MSTMKRMEVATRRPPATQPRIRKIDEPLDCTVQLYEKQREGTRLGLEMLIKRISFSGCDPVTLARVILKVQENILGCMLGLEVRTQVLTGGQYMPQSVQKSGWQVCSIFALLGSEKVTVYSNSFPSQDCNMQQQGRLDERGRRYELSVAKVAGVLQLKIQPNMQVQYPQEEQQALGVLSVQFEAHCCWVKGRRQRRRIIVSRTLSYWEFFIKNILLTNHLKVLDPKSTYQFLICCLKWRPYI